MTQCRAAGSEGEERAKNYLLSSFKGTGLTPLNNSYIQEFTFPKDSFHIDTAYNLTGCIDNKSDATIIIGGHYDHIGIGRAGAPLPVELMFLSGKCNLNNIKLQWATASETNSDYFTIERKKNNTEGWIVIGKIQGSGNSSSERNYEFTDEEITSGISYYRLKQTDFDGNSSSLKLIAVNCNDKTISSINIFIGENEQVFVMVNSDSEKYYNVSFYDASGRTVLKEIFDISKGDNLMLLNPKKLSTGIYFVTLQNDEEIITEKLFVR